MNDVIPSSRAERVPPVVVAAVTCMTVTLTAMFGFSWAIPNGPDMTNLGPLPSIAIGLSMAFPVLSLPAMGWAWTVGQLANEPSRPIIFTTLRVALPMFAVVGIAVDLSQLFIDHIWQWHDLAVHALFALAFAAGMAVFLGVVTWRVAPVVTQHSNGPVATSNPGSIGLNVGWATALGVVAGALLALPLDWAVVRGMGREMLAPLYLVLATGTFAGGFQFGRSLSHRTHADLLVARQT